MSAAVVVWTNVDYVSLSFLAGLLAIPGDIHAAARIGGSQIRCLTGNMGCLG